MKAALEPLIEFAVLWLGGLVLLAIVLSGEGLPAVAITAVVVGAAVGAILGAVAWAFGHLVGELIDFYARPLAPVTIDRYSEPMTNPTYDWAKTTTGYELTRDGQPAGPALVRTGRSFLLVHGDQSLDLGRKASFTTAEQALRRVGFTG